MAARTTARRRKKTRREEPASALALRIVQAASSPEVDISELALLADSDPGFALRLLRLVNSAAFGLSRDVTDTKRAVTLVGIRSLRNLALSLSLDGLVPVGAAGLKLMAISIRRAAAARLIAEALGSKELDTAFTTGLFLEVGLLGWASVDEEAALAVVRGPAAARPVRERLAKRPPHPISGQQLAREWHIPDDVVDAIAHHHDEHAPKEPLGAIAWLAEHMAGVYEGGDLDSLRHKAISAARGLGIPSQRAEDLLAQLPEVVTQASADLDQDLGHQESIDEIVVHANQSLVELNQHYEGLVRSLDQLLSEREELTRELWAANQRLSQLAYSDPLTGMANKRAFQAHIDRDLARADRTGSWLSLVLVDLDHFKQVNDHYGHPAGDEVLRTFGRLAQAAIRVADIAARVGGEEFALVLANTPPEGARVVAERIRARLEATPILFERQQIHITASFGIAAVRGPGCKGSAPQLYTTADRTLYTAKESGRNRVHVAS